MLLGMKEALRGRGKDVTAKLREALVFCTRPVPCPGAHCFTLQLSIMCSHFPKRQELVL